MYIVRLYLQFVNSFFLYIKLNTFYQIIIIIVWFHLIVTCLFIDIWSQETNNNLLLSIILRLSININRYKYDWIIYSYIPSSIFTERTAAGIGLHVNAHKTEYMCYNQTGDISTLDGASQKLVDKFTYLGSSVSSTEKDIDTRLTKAWTAIDRLSIIRKSDLTDKRKRSFFQAAVVSILLYGCTTWTLNRRLKKKLDGNYTRMLRAILNKSWRQHPTRHQLYGHLPPIAKTIQV